MGAENIGELRFYVFTDCSFTAEHIDLFLRLSGVPITEADLEFDETRRSCEWPLLLDPKTLTGQIDSIGEHIWHATNFLHDRVEELRKLRGMDCAFWLRAYCPKIESTIRIDLPIMERLVEWDIILLLIPEKPTNHRMQRRTGG